MKNLLKGRSDPYLFLAVVNVGTFVLSFSNWMLLNKR